MSTSYLGDGSRLERLVVDVRLNALDDRVWNVVLVELEQTVEELLRLGQQQFAWLPVIVFLLPGLSIAVHAPTIMQPSVK